jgi:hypothetical protein
VRTGDESIIKIPNGSVRFEIREARVQTVRVCNRIGEPSATLFFKDEQQEAVAELLRVLLFGTAPLPPVKEDRLSVSKFQ